MLVNWTGNGAKVIQVPGTQEMVVLAPGYNQVDDVKWKDCRNLVLIQIANENIIEEWMEVEINGKPAKDAVFSIPAELEKDAKTTVRVPATFKDITRKRTDKVIAETYHPKTLQKWYEDDGRDDVRAKLFQQMEGVNKGTITGERKKGK
jgi:hypothetical protein